MPNGEKVTWRSLHDELKDQSKERQAMEERLVRAFADGCKGIRDDVDRYCAANDARVRCIENDITSLKVADRKWGGITGLFAAGVTALGVWLNQR